MPDPDRRWRRPAISCTLCRKRKIRCNRENPCSNCVRARAPDVVCVYDNPPTAVPVRQKARQGHDQRTRLILAPKPVLQGKNRDASSISIEEDPSGLSGFPFEPVLEGDSADTTSSTPSTHPSTRDSESMRSRISQLEEELSRFKRSVASQSSGTSLATPDDETEVTSPGVGVLPASKDVHDSTIFGHALFTSRSVMHKKRLFGQSHWVNSLAMFRDLFEIFEPQVGLESSDIAAGVQKCKELARLIKARRAPPWPSMPTVDLPSRDIADELVRCYIRTTESVYRILHLPTFWKDYEAVWAPQAELDPAQIVPIKLVLAIGAATYDEAFTLRESAVRWIHECYTWLSRPDFKSRITVRYLQTSMLLLLAREACGVGWDMVWISMGELLRTAIHAGLHRDPSRLPRRTAFAAELRRRLWSSLLEMSLQGSLKSGGPPLISLDDYDTEPPGNFDDEQLTEDDPLPQPDYKFTQTSVARVLQQTFPIRLAIAKFLNDMGSKGTYEETLQLDAEFRAAFKPVNQALQTWKSGTHKSLSPFQMSYVDFTMRRSLLALHAPFFAASLHEAAFAYTRRVGLETSLVLWRAAYGPPLSFINMPSGSQLTVQDRSEFSRLTAYRSGMFRSVASQTAFFILAEIRAQVRDNDGLGDPVRPDLLPILEETRHWCLRCIEVGETNIKCYLLVTLIVTQVEGLMEGLRHDELPPILMKAIQDTKDVCVPILEKLAAEAGAHGTLDSAVQQSLASTEFLEDWDSTIFKPGGFNNGVMETMSWMFDDEILHAPIFG